MLRFDGLPWVTRAQQEHDKLAEVLREHGTEVIYLSGLLQDVLEYASARQEAVDSVLASSELGEELASAILSHLTELSPEDLAATLIAGLTPAELRTGQGLVHDLLDPHDFVIGPLPNLVFSRDTSCYVADQVVIGALPGPRRRETDLLALIYEHHPRFAGARKPFRAHGTSLDAGDLLLLGPGIVAVGVGVRSTPASAERLARQLLGAGAVSAVLAVPMNQRRADAVTTVNAIYAGNFECDSDAVNERDPVSSGPISSGPIASGPVASGGAQLGTLCTVLDEGVVLMAPALAFTLTALTITAGDGGLRVSRPRPFLEAAARALGIDQLTVIETGVISPARPARRFGQAGHCGQWDDGGNALATGGRVLICDERNTETNARLAAAGFEVVRVPFGELGGSRGGPRCLCTPLTRDNMAARDSAHANSPDAADASRPGYRARLTDFTGIDRDRPDRDRPDRDRPDRDRPDRDRPDQAEPGELAPLRAGAVRR